MIDRYDILAFLGLLMLAGGLYLVSAPLALIVPGLCLFILGIAGGAAAGRSGE